MTIKTKYLALFAAVLLLPASAFAQSFESRLTIHITKDWKQAFSSELSVSVHLSCTGGATLEQDIVVDPNTGGTFFVYDIINTGQDYTFCTVTENDVPDHYTTTYDIDGDSTFDSWDSDNGEDDCRWQLDSEGDADDELVCDIVNKPDPALIRVNKTWVVEGADLGFDGDYKIRVKCDVGQGSNDLYLVDTDNSDAHDWSWCGGHWCGAGVRANYEDGNAYYEFTLRKPTNGGECEVYEDFDDSVVESDNSCDDWFEVAAGGEYTCDIVNTVFFEGIPTLNQYGMAILALLMLGVGFVGFRRFV